MSRLNVTRHNGAYVPPWHDLCEHCGGTGILRETGATPLDYEVDPCPDCDSTGRKLSSTPT